MQKEPILILASASPRRKELLEQIGINPVIVVSDADEELDVTDPARLVLELSGRKCRDVAEKVCEKDPDPDVPKIVVGADTVVSIHGRILGKPADEEEAFRMLSELSGNTHEVFTGVHIALICKGEMIRSEEFAEETKVRVRTLTEEEILEYIATKEPMDKAGAYGIQGSFAKHVQGIEGDYFNVVGLPVCALWQAIKRMSDEL